MVMFWTTIQEDSLVKFALFDFLVSTNRQL